MELQFFHFLHELNGSGDREPCVMQMEYKL